MTFRGEVILRGTLRTILYGAMERFVSDHVVPEIEKNSVKANKDALLIKAEGIVDRAVSRAIREIKRHNFNSLDELEEQPELVTDLMDKIQQDMISDAESLQEN